MKLNFFSLCLLVLTALFTFSCYDDSDILGRLDALESDRVASIETQIAAAQNSIEALQAADVALDKYIDVLEAKSDSLAQVLQNSDQQLDNRIDEVYEMTMKEFALVKAELQVLNSQDSLLNVRLTELNDYIAQVEAQQKAEHDWVQQTFSTLEQYEATCAAIAGLEAHLQTVDGKLLDLTKALAEQKQALEQSIADAVTSVKSWVNEQLSGYYTIAQTDAKIAAVLDTMTQENAELRQQLTQMQDSLAQTRTELTEAYQSAIKQAIEEHDGKITKEIAAQVESLNQRIDDEVAAINAQLQAMAERLTAVEKEIEELKKIPGITFDETNPSYVPGDVVHIAFALSNADESTVVEALANGLWEAEVEMSAYNKGNIKVTTPDSGGKGKVLVFVNKGGHTIMRTLLFDQGVVRVASEAITVSPSDTTIVVELSTNLTEYKVMIPAEAQSWIRSCELPATKAAMRNESIAFEIDRNVTSKGREALVQIVSSGNATELATISIYQQSEVMGNNEIWYTSTDGKIVTPNDPGAFYANIVSNTYVNGKGIIRFDGDVTRVGAMAFYDCGNLKSISLPETVNAIGDRAFLWCSSLAQISLPEALTSIGSYAFHLCSSLAQISLPEGLTSIGGFAFENCSSLAQISLPESLTSIGVAAFDGCSSLAQISLPEGLTSIRSSAFRFCSSLAQIDLPEGLTSIGEEAFSGCSSLKEITIPKLIRRIAESTFYDCTNLETVVFEGSIISISSNAFYRCRNLKTFTISQDFLVDALADAFAECYVDKCELRVPYGRKATYEQHDVWKTFGSIVEIGEARENVCEAVDLGLSVKWATCNVGAYAPEEPGRYFAWGETEDKFSYSWNNYKYCNGSETTLTKYNTNSNYGIVDNKTTLDLSDDAARANWGGKWRMPTKAEQDELRNNCTWTWTTQNGVNGYKVTSKTNGNSIFLPAAGRRYGTSVDDVGSRGCYWSRSLNESSPYYLYFYSGYVDWGSSRDRNEGHTVRAVCP